MILCVRPFYLDNLIKLLGHSMCSVLEGVVSDMPAQIAHEVQKHGAKTHPKIASSNLFLLVLLV